MVEVWVPITVAIITGPIVVVLQKLRKENSQQHGEGRALIQQVADKVDSVGSKLDEHIGWHKGRGK